ncbi:hypothetical protein L6164_028701 [Bauhinia variegata]|uniref:Uncharacterized protein n=1 Tax=Bauhinia variegata TaxID=167791 RepID=A0ACB9L737_BAUVA|nr:hypothetical protein L6164_028701 [Bauhinia variegata]
MDKLTKANVGGAMEEQLCNTKLVEINPIQQIDPAKFPSDTDSSRKPYISRGEAGARTNASVDTAEQVDIVQAAKPKSGHDFNADMDPKKLQRVMANRISAQKSRIKKKFYVADLERKARILQDETNLLLSQVATYTKEIQILIMENQNMIQKMADLEKMKIIQEAEIEKNKAELCMLREIFNKQYAL